jgi:hypothetical protein
MASRPSMTVPCPDAFIALARELVDRSGPILFEHFRRRAPAARRSGAPIAGLGIRDSPRGAMGSHRTDPAVSA